MATPKKRATTSRTPRQTRQATTTSGRAQPKAAAPRTKTRSR